MSFTILLCIFLLSNFSFFARANVNCNLNRYQRFDCRNTSQIGRLQSDFEQPPFNLLSIFFSLKMWKVNRCIKVYSAFKLLVTRNGSNIAEMFKSHLSLFISIPFLFFYLPCCNGLFFSNKQCSLFFVSKPCNFVVNVNKHIITYRPICIMNARCGFSNFKTTLYRETQSVLCMRL